MRLIDIVTSPWAIMPEKLLEIRSIYETHLKGEKIDIKPIEAAIGRPLNNQAQDYEVVDGVAVIPIEGVIAKRMNLFMQISGGTSTELLSRDIKAALADPQIKAIVLSIDSPGGTIDGTADLTAIVRAGRDLKPIVAYTDGMMCSAAYWIGSAAGQLFIGNDTTQVGSIGVVATHVDVSRSEERCGVKTTEIYAGKYKRIASQYSPLSEEGRASIQERVDYLYSVFVSAVAENRGVSVETALKDMADGRIFSGKQAVSAGLVDGVSTLDALVAEISSGGSPGRKIQGKKTEGIMAKVKELAAEQGSATCPNCGKGLRCPDCDEPEKKDQDGNADEPEKKEEDDEKMRKGMASAKAERERIQGLLALSRPGREKLISDCIADGKSTKAEAAEKILAADDAKRADALKGLKEDGANALAAATDPAAGGDLEASGKDFMALVEAHQKDKNCSRGEAISATAKAHPEAHARWVAAHNKK